MPLSKYGFICVSFECRTLKRSAKWPLRNTVTGKRQTILLPAENPQLLRGLTRDSATQSHRSSPRLKPDWERYV